LDRFWSISGSVLVNFWTSFGQFLDHFWCPFLAPILVPIFGTDRANIMEIVTFDAGRCQKWVPKSVPKMGTKNGPEIGQNWSRNGPKLVQKLSKTGPEMVQIHIFDGLRSIPIRSQIVRPPTLSENCCRGAKPRSAPCLAAVAASF
jgi:hypothetical protein